MEATDKLEGEAISLKDLQRLIPLEATSEIFTGVIHEIEPSSKLYVNDVWSLDEENESLIFTEEVKSIIALFPICETGKDLNAEVTADPFDKKTLEIAKYIPQIVPNMCGTIAILHSILNCDPQSKLAKDYNNIIKKYADNRKELESAIAALTVRKDIIKAHEKYSIAVVEDIAKTESIEKAKLETGNEEMTEEQKQLRIKELEQFMNTINHFVCYISRGDYIVELNGARKGPIFHKFGETDIVPSIRIVHFLKDNVLKGVSEVNLMTVSCACN